MKYDFISEYCRLPQAPTNETECKRKLKCLEDCKKRCPPQFAHENFADWAGGKMSKRRVRLLRMYWALKSARLQRGVTA